MPLFLIGILKNALPFLWKYKTVFLILAVAAFVFWQHGKIDNLRTAKKALQKANSEYVFTLKTVRTAAANQINAMQADADAVALRQQQLQTTLKGVYDNDETVDCPVPSFMRDAFERM